MRKDEVEAIILKKRQVSSIAEFYLLRAWRLVIEIEGFFAERNRCGVDIDAEGVSAKEFGLNKRGAAAGQCQPRAGAVAKLRYNFPTADFPDG